MSTPSYSPLTHQFSHWFLLHFARQLTGTDVRGSTLLANERVLKGKGIPPLLMWPWHGFTPRSEEHLAEILRHAFQYRTAFYQRPQTVDVVVEALQKGNACTISFQMYDSFHFADDFNGVIPMPSQDEGWLDAHAVFVSEVLPSQSFSYNGKFSAQTGFFKCSMGWGPNWGDHGFGYLPFEYVKQHSQEILTGIPYRADYVDRNFMRRYTVSNNRTGVTIVNYLAPGVFKDTMVWVYDAYVQHTLVGWSICESKVHTNDQGQLNDLGLMEVIDLFVQPEYRLQGYGSLILGLVEQHVRNQRIPLLFGWIATDDTERDGVYPSTYFFKKRGYDLVERSDVHSWSKAMLYKNL